MNALKRILSDANHGDFQNAYNRVAYWVYGNSTFYGLKHDACDPLPTVKANMNFLLRPIEPKDIDSIFLTSSKNVIGKVHNDLLRRYQVYQTGTPTCYAAFTDDGIPCHIHWLIRSEHNDFLQTYFDGRFPILKEKEAVLEMFFTPPEFRRKGIMSEAAARTAKQAFQMGVERVVTFVDVNNLASLKALKLAGFSKYTLGEEHWRMFQRHISFNPLENGNAN